MLRTRRREGDLEMAQSRLRRGAEARRPSMPGIRARRPAGARFRRSRGHPVVFLARGSHAAYFRPGVRDRAWPDPDDEADGRQAEGAAAARARDRVLTGVDALPRDAGATAARAGCPGEMDSPRGPAFQPQGRWGQSVGLGGGGPRLHPAPTATSAAMRRTGDRDRGRVGVLRVGVGAVAGGPADAAGRTQAVREGREVPRQITATSGKPRGSPSDGRSA